MALTLKAFDEISKVVGQATNTAIDHCTRLQDKIKQTGQAMDSWGQDWLRRGLYGVGALAKPVEAFADLEGAGTRLQMTLMTSSGAVSEQFGRINELAIQLGNRLPGTAADFQNMFAKLIQLGITEQSLLGGVGEAAAYLGVVLKRPYEETAAIAAKPEEATGTADADMLKFIDTVQRTAHLGVDLRSGCPVDEGHKNHMRAINLVNRHGGIRQAVEAGALTSGILYDCVVHQVPYVLAGSIRDDGPPPDKSSSSARRRG